MNTKAEAEVALAKCELREPVTVADTTDAKTGAARRSYTFGLTTVEIDAEPSKQQLADLASHLPVPDEKRAETLAVLEAEAKAVEAGPIDGRAR